MKSHIPPYTYCILHIFAILLLYINHCFRAWIHPTSKKEGHCDSTVRTVDRYTIDRYTIDRYTVDRYTLYILHCLTVHTHTLSTPYIYCTLYVLCTLSVHLSQTSLLFATHVYILEHSYSHICSLSVHLLNT